VYAKVYPPGQRSLKDKVAGENSSVAMIHNDAVPVAQVALNSLRVARLEVGLR
jgi:hypothetical protein